MDPTTKELLHNGIAVAILVPMVGFVLWAGRAVVRSLLTHIDEFFKGVLEQQKESAGAMKELAKAFSSISERCLACINGNVAAVRDSEGRLAEKFVSVSAAARDKTFADIQAMAGRFESALTATAESIRRGQSAMLAEVERKRLEDEAQRLREENKELSQAHDVGEGRVRE